jgi:hypothetical protein
VIDGFRERVQIRTNKKWLKINRKIIQEKNSKIFLPLAKDDGIIHAKL